MASKVTLRGDAKMLAEILGLAPRSIQRLVSDQIIKKEPFGDFKIVSAVSDYYNHRFGGTSGLDFNLEKAKHEKAKRELAELNLAQQRLEMHSAEDVELVMTDMLTNLRSQLLNIPSKMAGKLVKKNKGTIEKLLTEEIEGRLAEIRDYTPEMFQEAEEKQDAEEE